MPNVYSALNNIMTYGTPLQKKIASDLKQSNIRFSIQSLNGEADTVIVDSGKTQEKINSQIINELQALDEIAIRIHPDQANSEPALEKCLVHEGRHAYHVARVVSEFSQSHLKKKQPYDPNAFTVEYAAYQAYVDYVLQTVKLDHPQKQLFINHSIGWGITKWAGKNLIVDTSGIYKFILDKYRYDGKNNVGSKISEIFRISPRGGW